MEKIAIIPIIKREMKTRRITPAELARGLKMNPASVNGMMNRSTLQVQKLADLSELFQYNFFREIATKLPYSKPDFIDNTESEGLKSRIKELELEVSILRQTIKDLAGK